MELKLLVLGLLHFAVASPTSTLQDLQMVDDSVSVGTYVRAVRAATTKTKKDDDFFKSSESEGDGEIGYSRKKTGGGKKGYQHFDSYHKKAGDNYELETEDSYGQEEEGQKGAHSHRHEQKEEYRERKPERKAEGETKAEAEAETESDTEDVERVKDDRPEIEHEELKEGASDGNGGVEAHGHDPNDYVLPEKYTYGSGEEYDF